MANSPVFRLVGEGSRLRRREPSGPRPIRPVGTWRKEHHTLTQEDHADSADAHLRALNLVSELISVEPGAGSVA